jgi:hypothetical protein
MATVHDTRKDLTYSNLSDPSTDSSLRAEAPKDTVAPNGRIPGAPSIVYHGAPTKDVEAGFGSSDTAADSVDGARKTAAQKRGWRDSKFSSWRSAPPEKSVGEKALYCGLGFCQIIVLVAVFVAVIVITVVVVSYTSPKNHHKSNKNTTTDDAPPPAPAPAQETSVTAMMTKVLFDLLFDI